MRMSLLILGLVTAAAGFIAIGFGIPVNAFSLGNTLIMAGTTAVVGGFLLIGLSAVVHQLRRIAETGALHMQPTALPMHTSDPHEAHAQFIGAQSAPATMPAARAEPASRAYAAAEPKVGGVVTSATVEESSIAWLRPKDQEPTMGERAVIEEFEASLAPQSPPRPAAPPPAARMPEPKPWVALGAEEPAAETSTPIRAEVVARPAPERAPPGTFDTVWPDMRPARNPEMVERARKPDTAKPAREEVKAAKANAPAEPRPVAILKSGMIDGMAYTLFADGSIEAVLPTGPIRFASVDALRAHLDKSA